MVRKHYFMSILIGLIIVVYAIPSYAYTMADYWAFNEGNIYDITTAPDSLKLFNKKTGKVVVEVRVTGKDKIEIPYGWFYTSKGNLLEITPEYGELGSCLGPKTLKYLKQTVFKL